MFIVPYNLSLDNEGDLAEYSRSNTNCTDRNNIRIHDKDHIESLNS